MRSSRSPRNMNLANRNTEWVLNAIRISGVGVGEPRARVLSGMNRDVMEFYDEQYKYTRRIRDARFWPSERHYFHLRWRTNFGSTAMIHRIMRGELDFMIHGFEGSKPGSVGNWFMGDFTIYREWIRSGGEEVRIHTSSDGSQSKVYDLRQLPREFIRYSTPGYIKREPMGFFNRIGRTV